VFGNLAYIPACPDPQSADPAAASQVDCSKASSVAGGLYRFYEINPQVVNLAQQEFTFTRDSQASIETRLGDARLPLEKQLRTTSTCWQSTPFPGDSIPMQLIAREAMTTYKRPLSDCGIIAFHVTSRFLSLAPARTRP
jgi:hypothetical protein